MKFYFFLTAFCFLFENSVVFAQEGPSVLFSPGIPGRLMGMGNTSSKSRILDCRSLLTKLWAYPNAQVTGICNEAEIACLRYGLSQEALKKGKEAITENFKATLPLIRNDAQLKLRGCQLAIEGTLSGFKSMPGAAGYSTF